MRSLGDITGGLLAGLEARMRAQRGRHSWDPPVRPNAHTTFRTCSKCGLVKVTRHEPDNTPRHCTEWERDGAKITATGTPICEDGIAADPIISEDAA